MSKAPVSIVSQVDLPSLEMSSWLANIIEAANSNEENTEGVAQDIQLAHRLSYVKVYRRLWSQYFHAGTLSSSYRIGRESGYDSKTIIMQYSKRQQRFSGLSLHEYFMYTKNYNNCNSRVMTIPHYVGASTQPTFPPTEAYAKSMLMIHSPWQNKFDIENRDFVSEFTLFLSSPLCPDIVKIPFNRVRQRVLAKTTYVEPTTSERKERYEDFTEAPDDLKECIQLASTFASNAASTFLNSDESMDFGESCDWSSKKLLVIQIDCWHHFVLLFQFLSSVTG